MFLSNRGSFRPETSGAYTLRRRGRRRPKSGSAIGACAVARLAGSGGPIGDYYGSANTVPLGRRVLRAQNGRLRRIPSLDQLEQEGDVDVVHVLGEPLVQDQDLVARVLPQDLGVRPLRGGELVALHQEIRKADVAGAPAHPAGLLGKAAGEVALARSGAPLDDDVGCRFHELAGARLADEDAVDAAPVVYHLAHLRVREAQACALHQPPHARGALGLPGVVHHHADPLVERHRHRGPVRFLQVEGLDHLAHAQLAQLPPRFLVDHGAPYSL